MNQIDTHFNSMAFERHSSCFCSKFFCILSIFSNSAAYCAFPWSCFPSSWIFLRCNASKSLWNVSAFSCLNQWLLFLSYTILFALKNTNYFLLIFWLPLLPLSPEVCICFLLEILRISRIGALAFPSIVQFFLEFQAVFQLGRDYGI